jgi:secreted PhoX family phosphatase
LKRSLTKVNNCKRKYPLLALFQKFKELSMSNTPEFGRRHLIRAIATIPFLPLGTLSVSSLLASACSQTGQVKQSMVDFKSATFISMPAPTLADAAEMATTSVNSSLNVNFNDGSTQHYQLAYQPFFLTGDNVPDGKGGVTLAGGYYDINNKPIYDNSLAGKGRQFFSDCPDGTSLISLPNPQLNGIKGKAVFAVVQFEYTTRNLAGASEYGLLPSPIAVLTLDQDQTTGKLSLVKYHNIDTSSVNGLWITCGASLSPWGTHLSSEEYEPDAQFDKGHEGFKKFSQNLYGDENKANPYNYGHLPEITVNPNGTGSIKKHYCLGRISHELVQVMPDNRTVLMGDDATNGGLFMFIADKEKDLSSGSLYVAKIGTGFSLDPQSSGAELRWIHLGHATSEEVEAMIDTYAPSDILTAHTAEPSDAGFKKIFISGKANWVKIKPGMEKVAAFLETHRYAYLVGGSMGFTKMEGTTVNIKDKIAYSALQNCVDSMVINHARGWNANSGIALNKEVSAGAVLAHNLGGNQFDTNNMPINSTWVPMRTKALLVGEDIPADATGNTANLDKIAGPDNLKFSEKMRTLFIGEDGTGHVNNSLWAYNVDTKQLSRILSVPSGAEATGLHVVDDINGWTYIMSNFQHPGDWGVSFNEHTRQILDPLIRANYKDKFGAAVGYITADPSTLSLEQKMDL